MDTNPPRDALIPIYLIADQKAYSSEKHGQVNAQLIARLGHCFIRVFTQLGLLLKAGLEPCLKTRRADARVITRNEGLIVQLRTGVT
ncbi:hypothetical protein SAMN05216387_11039 [Nitrosovibrio tenuis]|uniref:Uncharacterized protein n=1 Tax=Nitrosovibrio tenuis TaxID=1233 RepID=A0A1H7PXN6_9PROT|nr:hypothetical protein SAMN05216387_11039 [Nitrosovibrio tenuis]